LSFVSTEFSYAGKKSSDLPIKVYLVQIGNTTIETPVSGSKSMEYDEVAFSDKITYKKTKMDLMQFKIIISPLDKEWTDNLRYEVFGWLGSRTPQEFRSSDNEGKLVYGIFTNAISLKIINKTQGYVELDFQATTPYWLTEVLESEVIDCTTASPSTPITFNVNNLSNVIHPKYDWDCFYFPKIYIDLKNNATNFKLINTSDGNRETSFTNLTANEILFIDNDLEKIETQSGALVLSKFNENFFRLVKGNNIIQCYYPCLIQFVCQFPQFT